MTRIAELEDNQLIEMIKTMRYDIEEIKNVQLMGGDVITPKINQTVNDFDETSYDAITQWALFIYVQFTADTQINPYIRPVLKVFNLDGSAYNMAEFRVDAVESSHDVDNKYAELLVLASGPTAFKVKVYVYASDTGTINIDNPI